MKQKLQVYKDNLLTGMDMVTGLPALTISKLVANFQKIRSVEDISKNFVLLDDHLATGIMEIIQRVKNLSFEDDVQSQEASVDDEWDSTFFSNKINLEPEDTDSSCPSTDDSLDFEEQINKYTVNRKMSQSDSA